MTKKEELLQEIKLRRLIRKSLKIKKLRKQANERQHLQEEERLRFYIRHLITEGDVDADTNPAPYDSTALSALADAFNQILPVLKTGLRKLKRPEERQSYRAHVLQKFSDMFTNFEGLDTDAESGAIGESDLNEQEGDVTIKLDDDARVMPSDGGEDERFKEEPAPKLDADDDDIARLAIETEDPTGARRAFTTINNSNIEKLLSDTRKLLVRGEDKEEFKQYAMYNVDLWLLTYEKEIADELGVPPAFDKIVTEKPAGAQTVGAAAQFETEDAPVDDLAAELPIPGEEEAAGDDVDDITSDLEAILMM